MNRLDPIGNFITGEPSTFLFSVPISLDDVPP